MHVLILGARAPVCLEWARAFAESGWRVTVADSLGQPLSRFSCAAHHFIRLPEPRDNPDTWIGALANVITTQQINLVLPTCEEAFYLAYGRERLSPLCHVLISDLALLHRLHHKGEFATMSQAWSISAPETRLLTDPLAVQSLASERREWVFKPAYSRFASRTLIRPSRKQLAKVQPSPGAPWIAQRFIEGREFCSFSVLIDGHLRAHSCYHPRYRVGRGSGIYFQPVTPPQVAEFLEQFGNATGYTGQVGFDFIQDLAGQFHVLECNPRATSGVHLFSRQRRQLVASLGSSPVSLLQPTGEPHMIALAMLLMAAPLRAMSPAFWRDYRAARDVITAPGDRRPLTAQLSSLGEIILRAVTKRCGLLEATTADIEWNGQPLGPEPL